MTRLSKEIADVAFLSWAKPTSDTPEHIKAAAILAIRNGHVGGYSESSGLPQLREAIAEKLVRDNYVKADTHHYPSSGWVSPESAHSLNG